MRSLIIADLHHHTDNADYWLSGQRYERVIFLASYHDDVTDARLTAIRLRGRMDSNNAPLEAESSVQPTIVPNESRRAH